MQTAAGREGNTLSGDLRCKALEVVGRAEIFNPDVIIHTAEIPVNELKEYKPTGRWNLSPGSERKEKADEIADYLKSLE